jgi:hypothetical protein
MASPLLLLRSMVLSSAMLPKEERTPIPLLASSPMMFCRAPSLYRYTSIYASLALFIWACLFLSRCASRGSAGSSERRYSEYSRGGRRYGRVYWMERFAEKIALFSLDAASISVTSDDAFFGPPSRFNLRCAASIVLLASACIGRKRRRSVMGGFRSTHSGWLSRRNRSCISLNWRAKPLTSPEVVLELISHTTTKERTSCSAASVPVANGP